MQCKMNATLRKGGPRAFWKRRRDDSSDNDDDEMTPKRMRTMIEHQRDDKDDADRRTTNGEYLARTEALDHLLPGSESDHPFPLTNLRAHLNLSNFQEVAHPPSNDLIRSDICDQSERGVSSNPDNPIVSKVKLVELEMLVNQMSIN